MNRSSFRPQMENLEAREVPAVTVIDTPFGTHGAGVYVYADGNAVGEDVTVTRANIWDNLKIKDNTTGQTWTFNQGVLDYKKVFFIGGSGDDTFTAANALTPVKAFGNGGDDALTGGALRDYLDGGAGNDVLRGGGSGDTLYGRAGMDQLFGDGGNDFLDAGSAWFDSVSGGTGDDFLAHKPVVNGTTETDVDQRQTPTCWVLAPIAAAAKSGINLADRITYLGDGEYRVILKYKASNGIVLDLPQTVNLEGGRYDFEPGSNGQDESWVVLFHRAIMQVKGIDWADKDDYEGGWPEDVMGYLTGRYAYSYGSWGGIDGGNYNTTGHAEMAFIKSKLDAGKIVCACTRQGDYGSFHVLGSVSTPKLVGAHCYSVESVNMDNGTIVVRNPWGVDGGSGSGDETDGLITLTFNQFYNSMWDYAVS